MKVLSLKQPWAELVVQGRKTIELRKWNAHFRGEFLIHASKVPDEGAMKRFGFNDLPFGFIVGKAELVNVKDYCKTGDFKADAGKHLASEGWGNYGFILKDASRLKLVPAKGKLGFWDFEL